MIKDGHINIYGCYSEDFVEGDPLPCPKCRKSNTGVVVRDIQFDPPGIKLQCENCGYTTSEDLEMFTYDSRKAIDKAISVWNDDSLLAEAAENREQDEEENLRILAQLNEIVKRENEEEQNQEKE